MPIAALSLKTVAPLAIAEHSLYDLDSPKQTITLCHPVWNLESGGLEGQMLRVISGLPQDRFNHLVIARGPTDARSSLQLPENVELIHQDGPQRDLRWSRRLASILVDHRVDVLHLRGLSMLTDGVLAAQFAGKVRVVMSFHGFETSPPKIGPIKRRVLRWAIHHCDERWAVSAGAAAALASQLNMEADEFNVLPNGVDTKQFTPAEDRLAVRRRLGLPLDRPIILSIGNLKPIKGHDVLLDALALLSDRAANATTIFVGHDYLNGSLQRFAASHLSERDIRFVGRQDDVLPWYQAADLFVLPSHSEGLSNALLEAMACGLSVVATNVGGNADAVDHARSGLLVEPGCPRSLADAITELLADESQRAALGDEARRHVEQSFNIVQTRAEYERRYEALAGRTENDA